MNNVVVRIATSWVVAALVATFLVTTSAPAQAATMTTIAEWQMNEPAGARTMVDSSGNGFDGLIGSAVGTGSTYDGATGYRWLFASPTLPPAKPERVIEVPHDDRLNPGTGDYAVTIRYRTIQPFGNIIQKGQGGSDGGYWKIENPKGILTCVFRGVDGSGDWMRKEVNSGTPLNDGRWHTARCERTATGLTLTIDGRVVDSTSGKTGTISNNRPISIGGKVNCDQTSISCDYFTGDVDYVQVEAPDDVTTPPPPRPGDVVFQDDFSSGSLSRWSVVRNLKIDTSARGRRTAERAGRDREQVRVGGARSRRHVRLRLRRVRRERHVGLGVGRSDAVADRERRSRRDRRARQRRTPADALRCVEGDAQHGRHASRRVEHRRGLWDRRKFGRVGHVPERHQGHEWVAHEHRKLEDRAGADRQQRRRDPRDQLRRCDRVGLGVAAHPLTGPPIDHAYGVTPRQDVGVAASAVVPE